MTETRKQADFRRQKQREERDLMAQEDAYLIPQIRQERPSKKKVYSLLSSI